MPVISIIVPVYNAEETLKRCVSSIINQTFTDIEIILIDDGSTDKSGKMCDEYSANDIRVNVFHKENHGVSAARNTGIELAKGKYILFVDSDDFIKKEFCEQLIDIKKRYRDSFIWPGIQIVSPNNVVKENQYNYDKHDISIVSKRDVLKLSCRGILNAPFNKLYTTSVLRDNDIKMNENISIAEDLLFNLQYLDECNSKEIVIINNLYYCYVREGRETLDSGYRKKYYSIHRMVLNNLWDYCKEWKVSKIDIPLYYSRYWDYMQEAFQNNKCIKGEFAFLKRWFENSRILLDGKFQKSVSYKKEFLSRSEYYVMKTRCYLIVWLYDKIRRRK